MEQTHKAVIAVVAASALVVGIVAEVSQRARLVDENADINGAIGIIRKTNALPDTDLVGLRDRGDVVSPSVLRYKP